MLRVVIVVVLLLACLPIIGCANKIETQDTLRKAGYTEIKAGGWAIFGCSDDDTWSTKFTARNPQGQMVDGVVCCGTFKRCTIRF